MIMLQEITTQWEKNKYKLQAYFATITQDKYNTYHNIIVKIFELVLTDKKYALDKITIVGNDDYSGTAIFLIPEDVSGPGISEYLITHTYYGSCSGCDTLLGISRYDDVIPTQDQLKDYMRLSLHLIQNMRKIDNVAI